MKREGFETVVDSLMYTDIETAIFNHYGLGYANSSPLPPMLILNETYKDVYFYGSNGNITCTFSLSESPDGYLLTVSNVTTAKQTPRC